MKGSVYTLCYAWVLGSLCAALLTAAATITAPYRRINEKAEEVAGVLAALGIELPMDHEKMLETFSNDIRIARLGSRRVYIYSPPQAAGALYAVVVPFSGPGLWGPIKGFMALEEDMRTIRGVVFYSQEETPGLGAEIASEHFQGQFAGKSIGNEAGDPGIAIGPAKPAANSVDAITGATMTCEKVEDMLNQTIQVITTERLKDGR